MPKLTVSFGILFVNIANKFISKFFARLTHSHPER